MTNEKAKEMKRIKLLRIGLIVSVILVFISVWQVIFESADNFHKVLNWLQLIIWAIASIFSWFQYKKAKEQLQEKSKLIN